jgi:hypothetical protein
LVAELVISDDIDASLAQAAGPVACPGTHLHDGGVPGNGSERRLVRDSERILSNQVASDHSSVVLRIRPTG